MRKLWSVLHPAGRSGTVPRRVIYGSDAGPLTAATMPMSEPATLAR